MQIIPKKGYNAELYPFLFIVSYSSYACKHGYGLWLNVANHPAGVSYSQRVGGNVLCHHAAGTNYAIIANRYARQHAYLSPNPYVVANGDGLGIFKALVAQVDIEGMSGRVETAIGRNEHIVAKGYRCSVENDAVDVAEKVFADMNVVTIVAIERLFNQKLLLGAAK